MAIASGFSRWFLVVVVAILAVAVSLWVWMARLDHEIDEVIGADDVHPSGRWHRRPDHGWAERSAEELARVLSLPYLDAKRAAPTQTGVTQHDLERVAPGWNMVVSAHAPEIALMDAEGRVLHRWSFEFQDAFPGKKPLPGSEYFRRARITPNGDLLAIYQGGGMVKLDRASRLLWATDMAFYNDFHVEPDGSILAVSKQAVHRPEVRTDKRVLVDSIVTLGADGEPEERLSLLDAFLASPFDGLIHPLPEVADIFHTNTVEIMDGRLAELSPLFLRGRLLVSLREVDIVAVIDPTQRVVVGAWRGPWVMQHEPTLLPMGRILVFDNRGAAGMSRVVEFDPLTEQIVWEYRGTSERPLDSPEGGSAQRLANGNTLITESEQGRAVEVTRDGEIVWEFVSPHRAGRNGELVATLWEVVRLTGDDIPFAADDDR